MSIKFVLNTNMVNELYLQNLDAENTNFHLKLGAITMHQENYEFVQNVTATPN